MKYFSKISLFCLIIASVFAACDKANDLPFYANGNAPVLQASASSLAPSATDSLSDVITFSWSYPVYATDSSTIKYIVEIDTAGNNFLNAATKTVSGALSTSFTAKEINTILLNKGYAFNVPVSMEARVVSSYANNNEQLTSNVLAIEMTPYKIPPKIALPASGKLFIVGGATAGGWSNPVPTPSQELALTDETTFVGIFNFTSGQSYLLLPVNGSWDEKYGYVGSNNSNNTEGDEFKLGGGDLLAPAASGWYKLTVDFQNGKFSLTAFTQDHGLPNSLFVVGDATPGGWSNPVPTPSQQFTRLNAVQFQLTLNLSPGNYLFLPNNGDWSQKFGAVDKTAPDIKMGGPFKPEGEDIPAPDEAGSYKILVDFSDNSYTLEKQ